MKLRLTWILPLLYLVLSIVLLVGFGNIGHGKGIEMFFYVSLPAGFLSNLVEVTFKSGELALMSCFLAGLTQYAVIGYLCDAFRRKRKSPT